MNFTRLRYFCTLVEEESFTGAARRLHIAQQSLSEGIAKLERELRVQLIIRDRRTRAVELTDAGRLLYTSGTDLLRRADATVADLRLLASGRTGHLCVGVFSNGAAELTPAVLSAFRAAWPRVELKAHTLDFADFESALLDGTVDVALVKLPLSDDRLVATPLYEEPRAVMLSARHPLADADQLPLHDILDEPFFDIAEAPRPWADFWLARADRGGIPPRMAGAAHSSKIDMLMGVAAGGGVTTAPWSTQRFFPYPGLTFVPLTGTAGATTAVAARHDNTDPLVASFRTITVDTTTALIGAVPRATLATSVRG